MIFLLVFAGALAGQALFSKPVRVLGDPNFIGTAANPELADSAGPNWIEGREVNNPTGIALDNSVSPPIVYIADTGNNRVLAYQYPTQLTAGSFADLILGQRDQYSSLPEGPGRALTTGLNGPTGLAVDSAGNLYVADTGNNRILRYPKPFSQPAGYQFPNLIIGQTSFASATANAGGIKATTLFLSGGTSFFSHTGLSFDAAGNLWVTDEGNNRVLRFPVSVLTAGANGPSADTVIGQKDFVSNAPATSQTSLTNLTDPTSVAFDSIGNMLVADRLDRVLVFPPGSTTNSPATRYLGIAVPASSQPSAVQVGFVTSVTAAGGNIIVVDASNNRVLAFGPVATWPTGGPQLSPTANVVVGQADFTSSMSNRGGLPAANTLSGPIDLAASATELFVTDSANNRVLAFTLDTPGPEASAARVIGQLDFPYSAPNLVVGEEFFTSQNTANLPSGSTVVDYSSTPPHLYIADTYNNRILGFNDFTHLTKGQKADIVIGQPDLLHTVLNYPSNLGTSLSNKGLSAPTGLAVDSAGNLYVADAGNSRILRFPAPFASGMTALETADLVLGQQSFTSEVTDPTAATMAEPIGLAFTQAGFDTTMNSGYLVATDVAQNRVLLFQKPFTSGMSASVVLGQPDFTTATATSAMSGMAAPFAVAVDPQDHIIVADTGNRRISVFDVVGNLRNYSPPSFFLTTGVSAPESIAMESSGQFWVADPGNGQVYHYASVSQLPIANYANDASVNVLSPRSVFADTYNNLLVADGINRILYFAPALGVVNAANYIKGRALAPGALASVFPAVSTNVLATGTANNGGTFPLPTTLAGTQVIVNGTPSALLYVSPGQINFPLSMSLPTGGSVDVQVVSQATGQIFGGAELPLSSASPGLFAGAGGTGTGQVAALNQDNSVNSATNPLLRGQVIQLFATGQGAVANAPPDGQAATGLVPTALHPQILLGGAFVPDANIQYSGLAPDLVGVWQINFTVPSTVTAGNSVPITVIMNSIPSNNPAVPGQIAATIALK